MIYSGNVTYPPAPSAAPTSVRVSEDSSTSITVQWEEVECIHRNGNITGYSLTYGRQGSEVYTNETKLTIYGLTASTTYKIRVAARNSAGLGSYSLPINATTDGKLLPNA